MPMQQERLSQSKASQLQARNPSFGSLFQRRNVLCREGQSLQIVEIGCYFAGREAQVGQVQFGQLPPRAQAGDG